MKEISMFTSEVTLKFQCISEVTLKFQWMKSSAEISMHENEVVLKFQYIRVASDLQCMNERNINVHQRSYIEISMHQ